MSTTTAPQPPASPAARASCAVRCELLTAMSHFYRGEMGRIMIWRQRLDTTTSWAITVTSTIFTVAFPSRRAAYHFLFQSRHRRDDALDRGARYRFYDAFRARVRMLEAHFLVPIVANNTAMLHGEWQKLVCEDLLLPSFKISRFEAIGRPPQAQLLLHFLHHPRGLADQDFPARQTRDRFLRDILRRAQRRPIHPKLARRRACWW